MISLPISMFSPSTSAFRGVDDDDRRPLLGGKPRIAPTRKPQAARPFYLVTAQMSLSTTR